MSTIRIKQDSNTITLKQSGSQIVIRGSSVSIAHAQQHERGGSDEIDGDHLDIDFTPSNYTPSTAPAEAANVDDLAAHLQGIDDALASSGGSEFADSLFRVKGSSDATKKVAFEVDGLTTATTRTLTVQDSDGTIALVGDAPAAHATSHSDGGSDEIDAGNLGSGAATDGYVLTADGAGGCAWEAAASGSGDVVGPASSTDNAVARFDSTTGKLLQNSTVTLSDAGAFAGVGSLGSPSIVYLTSSGTTGSLINAGTNGSILGAGSAYGRQWIVTDRVNYGKNHDHGLQTNPTLYVHSVTDPDTDNTQWVGITHDQTDALYTRGSGVHKFDADVDVTGNIVVSGTVDGRDIAADGAILDTAVVGPGSSTDNAIARFDGTTGKLVQNGVVTISDAGSLSGVTSIFTPSAIYLTDGATTGTIVNASTQGSVLGTGSAHLRHWIITDRANYSKNHDHTLQTNPTLFIHSATNPDTNNTQWLGLTHDQTDARYTRGTGTHKFDATVDVTGNVVVSGTVDGRDVATDGTKLDGIEAAADVTDATNVAAAGAVMDSDISPSEGFIRKTGSGTYTAHKSNLAASTTPGSTDDTNAGYSVGSLWIDTTADIVYVCVDSTASAAVWKDCSSTAGGGINNVVEDTTPQLGGQLDVNGNAIGDGTLELLTFTETASAVNQVNVTNAATGNGPTLGAAGDDTNIDLVLTGKGSGVVDLTAGASLPTDAVDAITEIASALKSGSDATVVTGTAGTNGNLVAWNGDGDAVDGPAPPSGTIVGTSDSQTLTSKTIALGSNTVSGTKAEFSTACTDGTFLFSGDALVNVVEDTTPQLGGMLDVNGNAIGDGTRELLTFTEDASAVNHVNIENQATGGGPIISAAGDDANVDLVLSGKGSGVVDVTAGVNLAADSVDAITEIASALKSGSDGTVVTGTAGTNGNLLQWDANGDAVDASIAASAVYRSGGTDVAVTDGGTGASTAQAGFDALSPVTTQGDIIYRDASNNNRLAIGTAHQQLRTNSGATAPEWYSQEHSKSLTVEDPTSSEDISMFFTNKAITITEMRAVLLGSATPSVTWTIRHSTDRSAAGNQVVTGGTTTTSTTTGSDVASFNDATIPADSFVWLETTAQSGTVTELHVTVVFTED